MRRKCGWIDLHHRAKDNKMPVRSCFRNCIYQVYIKTFINHTEKPKTRMRNMFLILRIRHFFSCQSKMVFVYTAWKGMNIMVQSFLKFINAITTCENYVCFFKQFFFKYGHLRWCKFESG